MTGWQPGNGGQGEWNQPSFGPDPGTQQYGTDPYANHNPYASPNQYGDQSAADPYTAGYDQYGQYQQQYPQTAGFPAQGYGPPPPPPKRSKLPMILSLVAIVIIVGAVVAIVLVNRQDNPPVAQDPGTSSSPSEQPTSRSGSPTTSGGGERGDWLTIDNTADSGLSFQVPPDWEKSSQTRQSGLEVEFTGGAEYGVYECEGGSYVRTFAATGDVQGTDGNDLDLATTLEDFAKSFATTYYGDDAQVDVPAPTEAQVEGRTAMTVTAKVRPNVTKPNCQATEGEVVLMGVQLESDGQPTGVAMLVVVNDLTGGPAEPKNIDPALTQEIISTVRPG